MNYKLVSLIFTVFVGCTLTGCGNRKANDMLIYADSLISRNQDDSAMTILNIIEKKGLKDEMDIAYYNLLMTQVRYRLYLPPLPDSTMINKSIEYFKENGKDNEMLTRSYYYKGVTDEERGNVKSAILNLKNAENSVRETINDELENKIFNSIAFINYRNNEYSLALEYGKKTLLLSKKLKKNVDIAYALDVIALAYSGLGKKDSADFYMLKIIPYLKYIRDKERATLLNNIYAHSDETQRIKTIEYLKEAYRIDSSSVASSNLARYYHKMGMREESDKMWEQAMKDTNLVSQIKYTRGLIKQREDEGRYKDVGDLSKKLILLSDSLKHKQQEEKIKDLQTEYDNRIAQEKLADLIRLAVCLAIIALLAVALVAIYNKVKAGKAKAQLAIDRMQMQALEAKIKEFEKEQEERREKGNNEDKEKDRIIEDMKRALEKLKEKNALTLSRGRELYEHIKGGGKTSKWSNDDFVAYIDYYWSVDIAIISKIQTTYSGLSPRYLFVCLLLHQNLNEDDIMRIMGISPSTVRSIKSRIRKHSV